MKTSTLLVLNLALTAPLAVAQNCFVGPAGGIRLGNTQDTIYPAQPIGFAFPLGGTTYTDIHISDHGIAFLSNGGVPAPPAPTPFVYTPSLVNFGGANPMICPLWSDTVPGTDSGVFIESLATGCRVEWRNMVSFGLPASQFNLAMTLFPDGTVRFDYDPLVTNNSTFGGVSDNGIAGITTGAALPVGVDLSAGGATANDIVFENWVTANAFDMQNSSLLLVPTNPGWNYVLLGPTSNCALTADYGTGCGGGGADSIYESYAAATFDLAGASITWIRGANSYTAVNIPGTFVPPSLSAQPVAAGQLDGQQSFPLSTPMPVPGGATTVLNITTKGQVELSGPTVAIDFSPSVTELLDWPNTAFHCWHDFDQSAAGAGAILFEESGGFAYATWNGVGSFGSAAGTNTLQWQFNLTTGDVTLVVVSAGGITDPLNNGATLVGYSVGGVSSDPGATDLGSIPGGVVVVDSIDPLSLTTNGVPSLGRPSFGYVITSVPSLVPLAFLFFGDTAVNPGIPLDAIGMTGCSAWTNGNFGSVSLPVVGSTGTFTLPIPGTSSLIGTAFSAMGLAFSLSTPLNLITSNGNLSTIGN